MFYFRSLEHYTLSPFRKLAACVSQPCVEEGQRKSELSTGIESLKLGKSHELEYVKFSVRKIIT
jgi:hypothetical protein